MCGTTVLDAIGQKVATQTVTPLLAVGVVMILAGLAFNIAAAPFHFHSHPIGILAKAQKKVVGMAL